MANLILLLISLFLFYQYNGFTVFVAANKDNQKHLRKSSRTFDWNIIFTAGWLSQFTLCKPNFYDPDTFTSEKSFGGHMKGFVPTWSYHGEKLDEFEDKKNYGTAGFVGYMESQKTIYVIFRPTTGQDSNGKWTDAKNTLVPVSFNGFKDGDTSLLVHEGFNLAITQVGKTVVDQVTSLLKQFPDFKVVCAGHSLGGAMATLMVSILEAFNDGSVYRVSHPFILITTGAPRVGNKKFVEKFRSQSIISYRFTFFRDPVVNIPVISQGTVKTVTDLCGWFCTVLSYLSPVKALNDAIQMNIEKLKAKYEPMGGEIYIDPSSYLDKEPYYNKAFPLITAAMASECKSNADDKHCSLKWGSDITNFKSLHKTIFGDTTWGPYHTYYFMLRQNSKSCSKDGQLQFDQIPDSSTCDNCSADETCCYNNAKSQYYCHKDSHCCYDNYGGFVSC